MFNSGRRSDITYERELCNCHCEVFDRTIDRDDSDTPLSLIRTGSTDGDIEFRQHNPTSSTGRLTKKISVSEVKRRKQKQDDKRIHPAVVELRELLSSEEKQRMFDMKRKENKLPLAVLGNSLKADDYGRASLSSKHITMNPQVKEFDVGTLLSYKNVPYTLPSGSIEVRKLENCFPSKVYTSSVVHSEIRSQVPTLQKKTSFSYALTTQPSETKLQAQAFRNTITSQSTIRRPIQQLIKPQSSTPVAQSTPSLPSLPSTPKVHFQLQPPAPKPKAVRFCQPIPIPSTVTQASNSIQFSLSTPCKQIPQIPIPTIETQSHYQKTVRKHQQKSSKGGRYSAKFAAINIKNIVSVPGTECLEFGDQDSVILGRYTPHVGVQGNMYEHIQNRLSEPPIMSREMVEWVRGKEVSAFEEDEDDRNRSAAKTQRPTMICELD